VPPESATSDLASAQNAAPTAPGVQVPASMGVGLSYKVKVENYFGPLDLLLHLVKENEVDVTRVSLANVAEQYISYLHAMQKLDLEVAGEFLVLASQLLLIKSRTLAPPPPDGEMTEAEAEEEQDVDNSLELIRKLLDYKRFKDRARALDRAFEERSRKFARPRLKIEGAPEPEPEPLRDMELWDLVLLYTKVIKGIRIDSAYNILYREVPLEVWIEKILEIMAAAKNLSFRELLGSDADRAKTVGMFVAMLMLARDGKVAITQDADLDDIRVVYRTEAPKPAEGTEPPEQKAAPLRAEGGAAEGATEHTENTATLLPAEGGAPQGAAEGTENTEQTAGETPEKKASESAPPADAPDSPPSPTAP
jgi:segregation and condensation protein A